MRSIKIGKEKVNTLLNLVRSFYLENPRESTEKAYNERIQ